MRYVYIKLIGYGYVRAEFSDFNMVTVAEWFTCDVNSSSDDWESWLNNDSDVYKENESNATFLEKHRAQIKMISIIDIINHEPNSVPESEISYVAKSNLIEILKTWDLLIKNRSQQIAIYEEDGVYRMEEVQ
jgi:hypothetical protein